MVYCDSVLSSSYWQTELNKKMKEKGWAQRESRWIKYLQEKHVHSNRSVCESAKSSSFQSIKAISFQRFFFFFFCFCPRKYGVIVEHRFCHSTIALSMSVTKNQNHRENRSSILIWNDVDHSLLDVDV